MGRISKSNSKAGRAGGVNTQVPDAASMDRPGSDAGICEEYGAQIPSPPIRMVDGGAPWLNRV